MPIKNEEIGYFKKGTSGNYNGRPRKFVSLLKEQGYKLSEVNDCVQAMIAMTLDELKKVYEDPKATMLEKTVAAALKKSLDKGSLYTIETLLSRVFGKPKESSDVNNTGEMTIKVTYGSRDKIAEPTQGPAPNNTGG